MDGAGRFGEGAAAMGEESGQISATNNARSRKRDSLFLSARLRVGDSPAVHDVRVRNLSAGGLMAELDQPVAEGTRVHLDMRGLGALTGSIAWSTRGRVGVVLDQPIDPARARKPIGGGRTTPGYAKPLIVTGRR